MTFFSNYTIPRDRIFSIAPMWRMEYRTDERGTLDATSFWGIDKWTFVIENMSRRIDLTHDGMRKCYDGLFFHFFPWIVSFSFSPRRTGYFAGSFIVSNNLSHDPAILFCYHMRLNDEVYSFWFFDISHTLIF